MIKKQEYRDDLPFMTIENAVRKTGVSEFSLRVGVKNGTIPHVKSGRRIFINIPLFLEQKEGLNQCG